MGRELKLECVDANGLGLNIRLSYRPSEAAVGHRVIYFNFRVNMLSLSVYRCCRTHGVSVVSIIHVTE